MGGHGCAKVRLTGEEMHTEFVCIPRPSARSDGDGVLLSTGAKCPPSSLAHRRSVGLACGLLDSATLRGHRNCLTTDLRPLLVTFHLAEPRHLSSRSPHRMHSLWML
jgi:hypothetical protein